MADEEKKPGRLRRMFSVYDVKGWVNVEDNMTIFEEIVGIFKQLFFKKRGGVEATESFNEASDRYNLDQIKLSQLQNRLRWYARALVIAGFLFLPYAFYLVKQQSFHGAILTCVLTLIAFAQAFRFHFWSFQISKKKLGCTFREWLREGLLSGGFK